MRRRWLPLVLGIACLGAGRGGVDALAEALAERARPALAQPSGDVGVSVQGPIRKLDADLAGLLMARLRAGGARSVAPAEPDEAAARAAGFERLVRVGLELEGGQLRATGEVLALDGQLWDAPPEPRAHLWAEVPLDGELRAYLPGGARPSLAGGRQRVPLGDLGLLALDVGDLDGDGRAELVGATAEELLGFRLERGAGGELRAVERLRVPLGGRLAPLRPRAELATVSVADGALVAHGSRFAEAVRRAGPTVTPVRGYAFPGLAASCELLPGEDVFAGESCGAAGSAPLLPERFWVAAGLRGAAGPATAAIVPGAPSGTLWLRQGTLAPVQVPGVGAQVALAALDRGDVVATSEPSSPGEPDAITLRALEPGLPVVQRIEGLPGAVRALAAGDADGDGHIELLAVVRDDAARKTELWLIH